MVSTRLTSQSDTSLVKDDAPENIHPMVSTRHTFQADTSLLKDDAPLNVPCMNTTRLTSLAAECSRSGGRARQVQTIESAALSLFDIARSGDVMEVYALLRRFPSIWQSRDAEGCSALHAAASAGAMDMGQLLVHAGGADLVR